MLSKTAIVARKDTAPLLVLTNLTVNFKLKNSKTGKLLRLPTFFIEIYQTTKIIARTEVFPARATYNNYII